MTYIDYINYFWRMDEALGFSPVEAKLFLKLLDIANKLHWREDRLMIPMKRLMVAMDCSKNTILKARKRLSECGLIAVKPGNKNKRSACYQIICDYLNHKKRGTECDQTDNRDGEKALEQNEEQTTEREAIQLTDSVKKNEAIEQPFGRENEPITVPYMSLENKKDKDKDERKFMIDDAGGGLTDEKIVQIFHRLCPTLKKVKTISKFTRRKLAERANDFKTREDWERYFAKASESEFLCGNNKYSWQADFNWLIKDTQTTQKVLSGCYETVHRKKKTQKGTSFDNAQEYDIVRGTYHKQAYFTNDNHLAASLAG